MAKRKILTVRATKYSAAENKARKRVGKDWVVGDVRLKRAKDMYKKGMRSWQVVAHERIKG